MEHLAICVITLTTQEFSAYKKHDTAQAGPGGTSSNSYVTGIFLPWLAHSSPDQMCPLSSHNLPWMQGDS